MRKPIFRFALPPSIGLHGPGDASALLRDHLEESLGVPADVTVSQSYETLTRNLLSGAVDAAWAPPFVCAKTEPEGVRVLLQAIRHGRTAYASALVCRRSKSIGQVTSLAALQGKRVAWVDPWSVAGYLLPVAFLKKKGFDPSSLFLKQGFAGSYGAALAAVRDGDADLACVHCLPDKDDSYQEAIAAHLPGEEETFMLIDKTEAVPSDGVVLRPERADLADKVCAAFLSLQNARAGKSLLHDLFLAEGFAPAQKMAYRALYRIAPR